MKTIIKKLLFIFYSLLQKIEKKWQWEEYMKLRQSFKYFGSSSYFSYMDYDITGPQYIAIGEHCKFGHRLRLNTYNNFESQKFMPQLQIGNNVLIGNDCHIGCVGSIKIGNNVLMASRILIIDHLHGSINKQDLQLPPIKRPLSIKPIIIGNNVWIGEGVSIMPGVIIGDNVIIGANAVVTRSFPNNVVVAGVPAKIIKKLDE